VKINNDVDGMPQWISG